MKETYATDYHKLHHKEQEIASTGEKVIQE